MKTNEPKEISFKSWMEKNRVKPGDLITEKQWFTDRIVLLVYVGQTMIANRIRFSFMSRDMHGFLIAGDRSVDPKRYKLILRAVTPRKK